MLDNTTSSSDYFEGEQLETGVLARCPELATVTRVLQEYTLTKSAQESAKVSTDTQGSAPYIDIPFEEVP